MSTKITSSDLRIELANEAADIERGFESICNTFGHQTHDGIWEAMNPGWNTPNGKAAGTARMVDRWRSTTTDRNGKPNTIFLKATLPNPQQERQRVIAGMAIWVQASVVDGYGEAPVEDFSKIVDLETLYPENEAEQRYLRQLDYSLHKRRIEVVKKKATEDPPAVMVLDLCVVEPAFQRRGIAKGLVQWGLDEAKQRGGLEAITEASSMGRHVYLGLGFVQEGPELEYLVDDEFAHRDRPSNIFMRTGSDNLE
ncbi:Fc.00g043200.m01.CDS01 [Cosmosporella sp. VM-42]